MTISLVLADDHPALLQGLELSLSDAPSVRIMGKARDSSELLAVLDRCHCDILLSDYSMPGGAFGDGLGMLSFVRRRFSQVKIIVLTVIDNDTVKRKMMRLGVKSVLHKGTDMSHVLATIRAVHADDGPASRTDAAALGSVAGAAELPALSCSEIEVLRLYVGGASVTQIARQLHRTKQTVSTQKANAMQKLGLQRDVDLYRFAYQQRLGERPHPGVELLR